MEQKNKRGGNQNGRPQNQPAGRQGNNNNKPRPKLQATTSASRSASRGEAIRAQKRAHTDAERIVSQYLTADTSEKPRRANFLDTGTPTLKVIGIGGLDGGGSKNMILLEYLNDAIIIDCGNDLGVDLPGINYGI
jgi:hypothetical protein